MTPESAFPRMLTQRTSKQVGRLIHVRERFVIGCEQYRPGDRCIVVNADGSLRGEIDWKDTRDYDAPMDVCEVCCQ